MKSPPYGIKKELSKQWLQEGVILPLLDGLDELAADRQKFCINRLNEYLGAERAKLPLERGTDTLKGAATRAKPAFAG